MLISRSCRVAIRVMRARSTRRGRALLGLTLGIADLVVLLAFMQADNTVSWSF